MGLYSGACPSERRATRGSLGWPSEALCVPDLAYTAAPTSSATPWAGSYAASDASSDQGERGGAQPPRRITRADELAWGTWAGVVLGLLACALGAWLCSGCGDHSRAYGGTTAGALLPSIDPRVWLETPGRVRVAVPQWLTRPAHAAKLAELLAEVDASGVPAGWSVWVGGIGALEGHPSGPAQGWCVAEHRMIVVAYRGPGEPVAPLLPALAHEIGHALHGPGAGH